MANAQQNRPDGAALGVARRDRTMLLQALMSSDVRGVPLTLCGNREPLASGRLSLEALTLR
jgi:hypothetical protein